MTIFSLSSGPGISGLAVIRISGPECKQIASKMIPGDFPKPRIATFKKINKIHTNESKNAKKNSKKSSCLSFLVLNAPE